MARPRKKLIFAILEVLRRYTDRQHTLNQNDIAELLERDFDIAADRKSIKRNLTSLWEMGFPIEFAETLRMYPGKDGKLEESYIQHDFWLDRDFTDSELRLLIDSLLFSKHIPHSQRKELIEKLEGLSNRYFKSRTGYISTLQENAPCNRELFYTIEVLDEAIAAGKQVAFTYNSYGTDKKLHPRREEAYIVSPYQMVATHSKHYLLGSYPDSRELANYRVDRITGIRMLDTPARPIQELQGMENGLHLPQHMAEHIYMFGGESVPVTFRMNKAIVNDVIDWFGTNVTFFDETQDQVTARVIVNRQAMRLWALQYCLHITVLAPDDLAAQLQQDLQAAAARYQGE